MKTLIIGHGRTYKKEDIRCSPVDINEWFDMQFDCVDELEVVNPDIVFKIGSGKWTFAENNSYDRIIDCTGGIITRGFGYNRYISDDLLKEYQRVIKPNGVVYTDLRTSFILKKTVDGQLLKIEKKLRPGNTDVYDCNII